MRDFYGCSLSKHVEYHSASETMSERLAKIVLPGFVTIALLSGPPAWSQEPPADEPAPAGESADAVAGEEPAEPASEEAESDGKGPDVGLDEIPELDQQTHESDDDEFIPTEEIPVDQSIPFPTDI